MPEQQEEMVSRDHMETQIAITRVETLLSAHRDDFNDHAEKDDNTFSELFNLTRGVKEDVQKVAEKVVICRDELKKEIQDDVNNAFVTKGEFNNSINKIIYTVGGIMLAGTMASGFLSAYVNFGKFLSGN